MDDLLIQFGYVGLFVGSFLAASLLPFSSHVLAIALILLGYNEIWVVLVAGTGNFGGALFNYLIGYKGADLFKKHQQANKDSLEKGQKALEKWGAPILFFSWLPVVGDSITVLAGYLKMSIWVFSLWVFPGRVLHYLVLLFFI